MEKILVLDNYDSFTYNLVHYIESNPKYEVDVFRNDEITIEEVDKYKTIILSPGPGLPSGGGGGARSRECRLPGVPRPRRRRSPRPQVTRGSELAGHAAPR